MKIRSALSLLVLGLCALDSRAAETMLSSTSHGLRCTDEKTLAALTANDGSVKPVARDPHSPAFQQYEKFCKDAMPGEAVTLITRRKNTSIVSLNGQTWYVPNIDYMTPGPECIKSGTKQALVGHVVDSTAHADEANPSKVYHYARLQLDKPICFLGNLPRQADTFVSLTTGTPSVAAAIDRAKGQHVQITGTLDTPQTSNQPPDNMMITDPAIKSIP